MACVKFLMNSQMNKSEVGRESRGFEKCLQAI